MTEAELNAKLQEDYEKEQEEEKLSGMTNEEREAYLEAQEIINEEKDYWKKKGLLDYNGVDSLDEID